MTSAVNERQYTWQWILFGILATVGAAFTTTLIARPAAGIPVAVCVYASLVLVFLVSFLVLLHRYVALASAPRRPYSEIAGKVFRWGALYIFLLWASPAAVFFVIAKGHVVWPYLAIPAVATVLPFAYDAFYRCQPQRAVAKTTFKGSGEIELICSYYNFAWFLLIAGTIALCFTWLVAVDSDPKGDYFNIQHLNGPVQGFGYLLVSTMLVAFIVSMFRQLSKIRDDVAEQLVNTQELKGIADEAKGRLAMTLAVQTAVTGIVGVEALVLQAKHDQAEKVSEKERLALQSQYGEYAEFMRQLFQSMSKFVRHFAELATKRSPQDASELRIALAALKNYMRLEPSWLPDSAAERGYLELKTWFPHYAAMVQDITDALKEDHGRFKFYATLPLEGGPLQFFNISNHGADPLWSVHFLNGLLWNLGSDVMYRRYFLATDGISIAGLPKYTEIRARKEDLVLCWFDQQRPKAVPVPTRGYWENRIRPLKDAERIEEREEYECYRRSVGASVDEGEKILEVLATEEAFKTFVELGAAGVESDPVDVGFVTVEAKYHAEEDQVQKRQEFVDQLNNKIRTELGNANSGRLEFRDLASVIDQYPRGSGITEGPSETRGQANVMYVIEDRNEEDVEAGNYATFRGLFPGGEFYDLYAVWDEQKSRENGEMGDWLACVAIQRDKADRSCEERLYIDGLPGESSDWAARKKSLDYLFRGEGRNRIVPLFT